MRPGDLKRGGKNGLKVWSDRTWCKHFLRWGSPAGRRRVFAGLRQLFGEGVEWEEERFSGWYRGRSWTWT